MSITTITPRFIPLIQSGADLTGDVTQLPGYQPAETPPDYSGDVISEDMGKNAPPASRRSVDPILETARQFGDIEPETREEGFDPIVETAIKYGDLPETYAGAYEGIEQEKEKPKTSDDIIADQIANDPVINPAMGDKLDVAKGPRKMKHTLEPSPLDPNTGLPVDAEKQLAYDRETEEILQNKYGTPLSHLTNIPTGVSAITSSLLPGVENNERWEEAKGGVQMILEEIPMWLSGEWAIKSLSPVAKAAGGKILKFIDSRAPFELHAPDIGATYTKVMEQYAATRPPFPVTEQAGLRVQTKVTQRINELQQKPAEQLTHDDRAFLNHLLQPDEGVTLGMGGAGRVGGTGVKRDPALMGLSDGEVVSYFSKLPSQTITSGDAAVLWMRDHGLYPEHWERMRLANWEGYSRNAFNKKNRKFLNNLYDDPKFQALNKFDQVRVYAAAQRPPRQKVYPENFSLTQNAKAVGSDIFTVDTIRGCDNFCLDCYAVFGAAQTRIEHASVVKATLKGKFNPDRTYRFGTVGDPAYDWAHSVDQVKKVIARSPEEFDPRKGVYGITKLQSIDGLDTSIFHNLEVSLDPLFPDHMMTAMQNVVRLKRMDPDVNIYLRIRSFESLNKDLSASLDTAVKFAKDTGLPVLETRMRWKSGGGKKEKGSFDLIEGDPSMYKRSGPQMKLKTSALDKRFDPGQFSQCNTLDILEDACLKCGRCKNFIENQIGSGPIKRDPFADKPGTTLGMFYGETSTSMQLAKSSETFMDPGMKGMPEGTFAPIWDRGKPRFEVTDAHSDLQIPGFRNADNISSRRDPKKWLGRKFPKNPGGPPSSMPLPKLLKHDILYYEYPFLKDTKIYYDRNSNYRAYVLPGENAIYLTSVPSKNIKKDLIHEIQHLIQLKEGWTPGGASKFARDILQKALLQTKNDININSVIVNAMEKINAGESVESVTKALHRDYPTIMASHGLDVTDGITHHLNAGTKVSSITNDLSKKQMDLRRLERMNKMTDLDLYRHIGGEIEARAAGRGLRMSDRELRSTDPYSGQVDHYVDEAGNLQRPHVLIPEYDADFKKLVGGRIGKEETKAPRVSEEGPTLGMGFAGVWERMFGKKSPKPSTPEEAAEKIVIQSEKGRMNSRDVGEAVGVVLDAAKKDPGNEILNDTKKRMFKRLGEYLLVDCDPAVIEGLASKQGMTVAEYVTKLQGEVSEGARTLNQLSRMSKSLRMAFEDNPEVMAAMDKVNLDKLSFIERYIWRPYRKADNVRRQLLITQLATTARNIWSQGARVAVDVFDDAVYGIIGLSRGEGKQAFGELLEDFGALYRRMTPQGRQRFESLMNRFDDINLEMLGDNISDVALSKKALRYLNSLNRMQEHYFRRVAFDARLTALTKKHGLDPLKDNVPDWILKDSFEHAMEMTFQASGGKLAQAMRHAYSDLPILTTVNPFPRFWANSINFLLDFGPLGFARAGVMASKKGMTDEVVRTMSRATVGTMMIGAAWQLRNSDLAGPKYYLIKTGKNKNGDDTFMDTRSFSPFSTYLAFGEMLKGEKSTMTAGDMIQAFIGINRIAGTGLALLDVFKEQIGGRKTGEAMSDTTKRVMADVVAQFVGGYTVPLKTIKDALGAIDPSQATLQSTKVDLESGGAKTMLRPALSNVPYGNKVNDIPGMEGTVVPSTSITRTDKIRAENPLSRQLTGISLQTRTPLEQEIDKLAIDNLSPRTGTPEVDRLMMREIAQAGFVDEGNELIESEYYKFLDPQERIAEIRKLANGYRAEVRDEVKFDVYNNILSRKKSAMDRYKYILKLVEKGRVNAELLENLMDEHDHGMSSKMLDKIEMTFETKVRDPYGPMAGVNAE
jgi:hypothetical protein